MGSPFNPSLATSSYYVQLLDPDINVTSTSEVTIYMTGVEPKGNVRTSGFTRCGKLESIPNSWFFVAPKTFLAFLSCQASLGEDGEDSN